MRNSWSCDPPPPSYSNKGYMLVPEEKVTECLWAETFRGKKGEDIGYVTICHSDFAFAEGYSPRLQMVRSKTFMQGDALCNHRWIWRG